MADRDAATLRVIEELKRIYKTKIMPVEQLYKYDIFNTPLMTDAEFDSKPQVMLVGQYSVGKTSFIRYLIGTDFPGQRIGPEPTTDRFVAVMDGPDQRVIPGNALAVSNDMPYRGLEKFGVAFLNRFEGSQVPSQVLRNITFIDTPGVLSGEKQRVSRGYDFTAVTSWFAQRADLILLLFDAHKLDISDEFRAVIESLKGNDDKIRCILNKADQVDRQKLMRVYGALMWSLGKVMKTPEVLRVYVGSFWDQPLLCTDNKELFELEERDLMRDLKDLPRNSAMRKINELVKRVRMCKVHAYILAYLRDQMPMMYGHAKKQKELIDSLGNVFRSVLKLYNLAPGDFPDITHFQSIAREQDFSQFPKLKQSLLDAIDAVLSVDIPRLMDALPRSLDPEGDRKMVVLPTHGAAAAAPLPPPPSFTPSVTVPDESSYFSDPVAKAEANPFDDDDVAPDAAAWGLEDYISMYQPKFNEAQEQGFVSGTKAKTLLLSSGLAKTVLRQIWDLADVGKDGKLDLHEFVIAMFFSDMVKEGHELPAQLDAAMIPPGARK